MNKTRIIPSLLIVMGATLAGGSALAEEKLLQKAQSAAGTAADAIDSSLRSTGKALDGSVQKAKEYVDDSAVTAKVKKALLDESSIQSGDISVATTQGVVSLSGFVGSQEQAARAVEIAGQTEGVVSVNDGLHVKDGDKQSLGAYTDDAVITGEIKTKLLTDDIVPARKVKVQTSEGIVLLRGEVDDRAQADRGESIAKQVSGVKSVKNDLVVKS